MLNTEYDDSLLNYEEISQRININSFSETKLEVIDRVLLSYIDSQWRKSAFVIGRALKILDDNQENHIFTNLTQESSVLLAQRLHYLSEQKVIEVNGDIRAIRFSEVRKIN